MSGKRAEFSKATKLQAWERANGHCEKCKLKILGRPEYDHIIPCALGGDNSLDNCMCKCAKCHREKTSQEDIPRIAKANRVGFKHAGIKRNSSRPIPGSKASGIRKRMNGNVEKW